MTKSFSILTSCSNQSKFLKKYIKSLSLQNYNFEIIFIDDCSSDNSYENIHELSKRFSIKNIKIIRNEKKLYCSSSYKLALDHAKGEICAIVDADDALVEGAIRKIVKLYEKYNHIGYIYTQHWWCDENMKRIRKGISSIPKNKQSFASLAINRKHCFSHWRTFRKVLSEKADIFPEGLRYTVDKNMGFILQTISKGGYFGEPLYDYRYYKGNMSKVFPKEQRETWLKLAKKYVNINYIPVEKIHA